MNLAYIYKYARLIFKHTRICSWRGDSVPGNGCPIKIINNYVLPFYALIYILSQSLTWKCGNRHHVNVSMTISLKSYWKSLVFGQCLLNLQINLWNNNFRQWKTHFSESMGIGTVVDKKDFREVTKTSSTVKFCTLATRLISRSCIFF